MQPFTTILASLLVLTYASAETKSRSEPARCGRYLNVERITAADTPRFTERLERAATYADLIALRHLSRADGLRWDWRPWSGTVRIDFPRIQTSYPDDLLALVSVLAHGHDGRAHFTSELGTPAARAVPGPGVRVGLTSTLRAPVEVELFAGLDEVLAFAEDRLEHEWNPQVRFVEVRDAPAAIRDLRTRVRSLLARYR